jgi:hypothetical protein
MYHFLLRDARCIGARSGFQEGSILPENRAVSYQSSAGKELTADS